MAGCLSEKRRPFQNISIETKEGKNFSHWAVRSAFNLSTGGCNIKKCFVTNGQLLVKVEG